MRRDPDMLTALRPAEAYRRIDFDARVAGARPEDLVLLCYERFDAALGQAIAADRVGKAGSRSKALTDALAALTALQLGVDPGQSLASAFHQIFNDAKSQLLLNVPVFDAHRIAIVRKDFAEIAAVLRY